MNLQGSGIGTLNESALHAALREWYARPGDRFEMYVDGYLIDIVRGDTLIEVQTSGFSSIKRKIGDLVERHSLRLVHPVALEKWIVKVGDDGVSRLSRRKSPKRGRIEDMFWELVRLPDIVARPSFSLDIVLIRAEEVRQHQSGRRWRRGGWVTIGRKMIEVVEAHQFETVEDVAALLPADVTGEFTTGDLSDALGLSRQLAQKMAYCLREMGAIRPTGKRGRSIAYARNVP
ncbi:MAG: hypothetical protein GX620_11590 [Chloroflexi bacterium]|nr:hypothetical protein [Chloroflexota bacterium]